LMLLSSREEFPSGQFIVNIYAFIYEWTYELYCQFIYEFGIAFRYELIFEYVQWDVSTTTAPLCLVLTHGPLGPSWSQERLPTTMCSTIECPVCECPKNELDRIDKLYPFAMEKLSKHRWKGRSRNCLNRTDASNVIALDG
jgi:hypothetical protein